MKVVIIGGGPAGRTAAMEAAGLENDVTLIEKSGIGGTCLNEGCMVICGLNDVAKFINTAHTSSDFGVNISDITISFKNTAAGIKKTLSKIRKILEYETKDTGVEIVSGNAEVQKGAVLVDGRKQDYDKLLIATGARPFIPPIKGSEHAMTYKDVLELPEIPEKLNIIGSGVMAAEFANIFSTMGSQVKILCRKNFLKMLDPDIKKYVTDKLLEDVEIIKNVQVSAIGSNWLESNKGKLEGHTLLTTGMVPNSEIVNDLVDTDSRGNILVNKRMETSDKNIYAAGDVTGGIANTPVARMEGIVAARNMSGIITEADYRFIPSAISLQEDVAFLTSDNSSENKEEWITGGLPGSAGPGAFWKVFEGKTGFTKIVIQPKTGDVKKIFSISPSSRNSIAYMSKMLRDGYKTYDFDDFIETHPSTDAIYKLMRFFAKFS
ncbi:MAG: NAD(P)/FAD-dependent oxidoreductase [Methanobacteriaceae archaeon]|jgi:dihydrolipoamide dehydrogenase|nr:NAD(P)/FAD-dependent oxidoreductase [Methanobacteriaceae archaeon]